MATAEQVAAEVGPVPLAFGTPWLAEHAGDYGQKCHNSYVVAQKGQLVFRTDKIYPAQGGVFDEWRVHVPGNSTLWTYQGLRIGFPICEDIWHDKVVDDLTQRGANLLLVPNGSPAYVGKPKVRHALVEKHVQRTSVPMLYLNHVGGQDEHAFDGGAFFVNNQQPATVFGPYWQEGICRVEVVKRGKTLAFRQPAGAVATPLPRDIDYMLDGIVLATRDYLLKSSSLRKVVIGVSGGVDSAVVLGLAKVMGLTADQVIAVSLPTNHNTKATRGFAQQVCDNLEYKLHWWPIQQPVEQLTGMYEQVFGWQLKTPRNAAYENMQSRERGQVLMAVANREGAMLLSTGNKSEMAMGFATLYGDMNAGYNPLKTVYKTQVYLLAHAINARLGYEAIPVALVDQKPSPELDDNQFDENNLPPYPVLDTILARLLDEGLDVAEIVQSGPVLSTTGHDLVQFAAASDSGWAEHPHLGNAPAFQRYLFRAATHCWNDDDNVYTVHPDCVFAVAEQFLRMRFKRYQAPPGVTMTRSGFDDGEANPIAGGLEWLTYGLAKP